MALVAVTAQLKAKLMAKGQHRPHNMIRRKLPDGADMLDNLPKRASGAHSDDEGANDEYCAAIDKVTNVFGAQKRAQTTADEHKMYMRILGIPTVPHDHEPSLHDG